VFSIARKALRRCMQIGRSLIEDISFGEVIFVCGHFCFSAEPFVEQSFILASIWK